MTLSGEVGNVTVANELDARETIEGGLNLSMKKGIILTLSLILTAILITAGILGCNSSNPSSTNPPTGSPQTVPAQSSTPEVKVSLNNQIEGIWVSGTGKVTTTPDIATLQLGIDHDMLPCA